MRQRKAESQSPWLQQNLYNQQTELEIIKSKYEIMRKEWDEQQENLGRLQGEVYKLQNQLQTQSSFCAALGSILGNLLWKSSRIQTVVELLLKTNKLSEFFCIVSGTLVSFMGTYAREMPEVKCNETQFILALCGVIANIAAVPEGRQFIVSDPNGKELLQQIIRVLPSIPSGTGDPLRRIILMTLYNISINQTGLSMIQEEKNLLITLSEVLTSNNIEMKLLGLKLLESITFEVPTTTALLKILHEIKKEKLESLAGSNDSEVTQFAKNVLTNLRKAELSLGFLIEQKDLEAKKQEILNETCRP